MKQALQTGSATALPVQAEAPPASWPPLIVTQPPTRTITTGVQFIKPRAGSAPKQGVARAEGQHNEAVQAPCTPQVSVDLGGLRPTLPAGQAQQGSLGGDHTRGSVSLAGSSPTSGLLLLAGVAEMCEEWGGSGAQQGPSAALSQFQRAPASWQCQGGSVLEVAAVPSPAGPAVQVPAVQVPAGPELVLAPAAAHTWVQAAPVLAAAAAAPAAGRHPALKRGLDADAWEGEAQHARAAKRQQQQQQANAEAAAVWHSASLIQYLENEHRRRQVSACMIAVLSTLPAVDVAQLMQARSFLARF